MPDLVFVTPKAGLRPVEQTLQDDEVSPMVHKNIVWDGILPTTTGTISKEFAEKKAEGHIDMVTVIINS